MNNGEKLHRQILTDHDLSVWTIVYGHDNFCDITNKIIKVDNHTNTAMFLHEVAHAICHEKGLNINPITGKPMGDKTQHHSIFADTFTALVNKYMILREG